MTTVDVPRTLPERLYLLAYDPAKGRLTGGGRLGYLLRAAALTELLLDGRIEEVDGRPRATAHAARPADPLLAGVLDEIGGSRPHTWRHWIRRRTGVTKAAVAQRLAGDGWIELHPRRLLGVLPVTTVVVRDPAVGSRLGDRVRAALRETTPVSRVDPRDAALVVLAAAAELSSVLPRAQRHEHRQRIEELTAASDPVATALHKVIREDEAPPT